MDRYYLFTHRQKNLVVKTTRILFKYQFTYSSARKGAIEIQAGIYVKINKRFFIGKLTLALLYRHDTSGGLRKRTEITLTKGPRCVLALTVQIC